MHPGWSSGLHAGPCLLCVLGLRTDSVIGPRQGWSVSGTELGILHTLEAHGKTE